MHQRDVQLLAWQVQMSRLMDIVNIIELHINIDLLPIQNLSI
jgi:hypothetical protein